MADRALRELKQLGKVTSERIVRVVDQGRLPDSRVYVATEQVEGADHARGAHRRARGRCRSSAPRQIVLQVGEALTEAQKVGVIHRDVAPRNVLVGPGDRVKVGDFGLAEAVSDRVFGAPGYLSPEQAEGKPVDQRSNIYSLGAVYYFALTGKAPFAGDAASLMQQHLSAVPQPPSSLRVGIGADIDRVILKALEKSGGRRHLTLRQLLTEVGQTSTSGVPAQPMRAGAEAKTMMAMEAPQIPPKAAEPAPVAQPQARPPQPQGTMLGIPPAAATGPVGSMGPGATQPTMPVAPAPQAQPQAPTMMAEAPRPVPRAQPVSPAQPVPQLAASSPSGPTTGGPQPGAPQAPMPTPMPQAPPHAPQAPQAPPQAPTMMAEAPRAPSAPANHAGANATPPHGAGKANNQTGKKGAFRETAWFKRGEIEEEMAKAQAAVGENALKSGVTGQHLPVDESQVNLSAQDRDRLSLKTGVDAGDAGDQGAGAGAAGRSDGRGRDAGRAQPVAEVLPHRRRDRAGGRARPRHLLRDAARAQGRGAGAGQAGARRCGPAGDDAAFDPTFRRLPRRRLLSRNLRRLRRRRLTAAPSPSLYAAQVAKLEAKPAAPKEDSSSLEKLVVARAQDAHKKQESARSRRPIASFWRASKKLRAK